MKTELTNGQQWHKNNTSPMEGSDKVTIAVMTGEWEVRAEGHRYYMGVEPYYCDRREAKRDTMGFELHITYKDEEAPTYWVETYYKALDIFGLGDYGTNSDKFDHLQDAENFIIDKIATGLSRSIFHVKLDRNSSRTYAIGEKYMAKPASSGIIGGQRYFESFRDIKDFYSNVSHSSDFELNIFLVGVTNEFLYTYKAIKTASRGFTLVKLKDVNEEGKQSLDSMIESLLDYVQDPEGIKIAYELKEAIKELGELGESK